MILFTTSGHANASVDHGTRRHDQPDDLFGQAEFQKREPLMREAIDEVTRLLEIDDATPWSQDVKATDDVLDRIFRVFFKKLKLSLTFRKSDYHVLARLALKDKIDPEITEKLDAIVEVANRALPNQE